MDDSKKRSEHLRLRVTKDEKEQIEKKCEEAGMSYVAEYIRHQSLHGLVLKTDEKMTELFTKQLVGIGNNINQIARRANEYGAVYDKDIDYCKEKIMEILTEINNLKKHLVLVNGD
jgi:hypothetical protein